MLKVQKTKPIKTIQEMAINTIAIISLVFFNVLPVQAKSLAEYCELKVEFATSVLDERDTFSKHEVIDSIYSDWVDSGRKAPWYVVVDMQRIVNDVYRTDKNGVYRITDKNLLYNDEMSNCIYDGF